MTRIRVETPCAHGRHGPHPLGPGEGYCHDATERVLTEGRTVTRIVAETPCACGRWPSKFLHKIRECPPECADSEWGHNDDFHDWCPGGSRRVLTEGEWSAEFIHDDDCLHAETCPNCSQGIPGGGREPGCRSSCGWVLYVEDEDA